MMNFPLISICIPTFNGARFIEEAICSAKNQKYENLEIVIVDDGSSDDTPSIIRRVQKSDPRIKFFNNNKNLGLVKNWARCIELSRGEYIKFLFQDDILTDNCVLEMYNATKHGTYPFVICNRSYIFEESISKETVEVYNGIFKLNSIFDSTSYLSSNTIKVLAELLFLRNFLGEPVCYLFKRDLIDTSGRFNHHLLQLCDFEFALRVALRYGAVYIPDSLIEFRVHNESETSNNMRSGNSSRFLRGKIFDKLVFFNLIMTSEGYRPLKKYIDMCRGEGFLSMQSNILLYQSIVLSGYFQTRDIIRAYYPNFELIKVERLSLVKVIMAQFRHWFRFLFR